MLIAILMVITPCVWASIALIYFRRELKEWFDNRYGPTKTPVQTPKPQRRRLYD